MSRLNTLAALVAAALATAPVQGAETKSAGKADARQIERGRYLVVVGNCNDCHTAGYAPGDGKTPEKQWLLGDDLGFRGPWGTTYAPNLRLSLPRMTEDQWVHYARHLKTRPPMPWFTLSQWTDADLRALYRYVGHLGPAGKAAPDALPPGQEPRTPVLQWPAPPKGTP
jgi:mono/diheme cytochrome c family protein